MENNKAVAQYELAKANDALKEAKILYDAESYSGAANRAYYSAFHTMSAMLAFDGYKFKSHAGVLARFREYYVKTGEIDKSVSPKIDKLFRIRTSCDYDVFYVVAKSDVKEQIENAETILSVVKNSIERKMSQVENVQYQEQPLRKDLAEQQAQLGYIKPHVQSTAEEQKVDAPQQTPTQSKKNNGGRHI